MSEPPKEYTATEASRLLGVPRGTIYSWRSQRLITPRRVLQDGTQLYVLDEIRRVVAEREWRARRSPRGA